MLPTRINSYLSLVALPVAVGGVVTEAISEIIHIDGGGQIGWQNPWHMAGGNLYNTFNLTTGGNQTFQIHHVNSGQSGSGAGFFALQGVDVMISAGNGLSQLQAGHIIGQDDGFASDERSIGRVQYTQHDSDPSSWTEYGPWDNAHSTGFAGIQYEDAGGLKHYGWIEIQWFATGYKGFIDILGWAYESTAGQSIKAGDTGNLGEGAVPGGAGLAMLAMGAGAIRRKRKK